MTDTALVERDEAIAEAIVSGRSLRSVRKEFSLSAVELDNALERLWRVDTAARLRMVKSDLGKLDRLLEVFYAKGLQGDPISAGVAVKIWEVKHHLTGVSGVKIDLSIVPPQHQTGHERIRAAIYRLVEQQPPAQRAAINKIEELGAERALELLNAGNGDSDTTNGGSEPQ